MPDQAKRFVVMHGPKQDIKTEVTAACVEIVDGVAVFHRTLDAALKDIFLAVKDFGYLYEIKD